MKIRNPNSEIPMLCLCAFVLLLVFNVAAAQPSPALAHFTGAEFSGGAKDLYGSSFDGEEVNYVYAAPTGKHSSMQAKFSMQTLPAEPLFVHLRARDDDGPKQCAICIDLNGKTLFEGANQFAAKKFSTRIISIPEATLKSGENVLTITCREKDGRTGQPPWFQVAGCVIAGKEFVLARDLHKDFWVTLPKEKRQFPEPLAEGKQPGFKFRGTKGWMWTPQQTMAELPWLVKFKMNFFMNCYGSMCDLEHYRWGDPNCNRWWEDLPAEKKTAYEEIVRQCQKLGIIYCFSMNPNLCSKRFINDGNAESVDQLFKHYAWMQSLGVKWFNISLDDISQGINASGQAKVVNDIFHRLRAKDPEAQMIFCPTFYWGDGTGKDQQPYLETLARELDKEVYLFWTGDAVVGKITRKGADTFRRICGHRVFLWDNYPVNDDQPTMHLGPVLDRDPDLCEVIDGYMGNPHCKQNEVNRIPLATCADYAWNPTAYDPERSIGQAILQVADTPSQQETLKNLVEAYPGMLVYGNGRTGFNSVQEQFNRIVNGRHSRQAAIAYIEHLRQLSERLKEEFRDSFEPEKATLDNDIVALSKKLVAHYGAE